MNDTAQIKCWKKKQVNCLSLISYINRFIELPNVQTATGVVENQNFRDKTYNFCHHLLKCHIFGNCTENLQQYMFLPCKIATFKKICRTSKQQLLMVSHFGDIEMPYSLHSFFTLLKKKKSPFTNIVRCLF